MTSPTITLSYVEEMARGAFTRNETVKPAVWKRLTNAARELDSRCEATSHRVEVSWPTALSLLRTLSSLQTDLGFEFDTDSTSEERVQQFILDYRAVRKAADRPPPTLHRNEIQRRLDDMGWNSATHQLKPYQLDNLGSLLSLSNGANFSVPGAGKTTVTFALHLLSRPQTDRILVVAPKNAFPAWEEVIDECLVSTAPADARSPFNVLSGGEDRIRAQLREPAKRHIISYDQLVRLDQLIALHLSRQPTHLVLDESHRMKAGFSSMRGTALLRMGHLAVRRDILTGTPMPQDSGDLQSQLDFLWPGSGLGARISRGEQPRSVMSGLYVRTTKGDLGLKPRRRQEVHVTLSDAHLAFYAVLRDDLRARASALRTGYSARELARARRSVVRLLQCAVNPALVAESLADVVNDDKAGLLRAVVEEGVTQRVRQSAALAERLAAEGKKVLIWTIFTATVHQLGDLLSHLNPAFIYGAVGVGDEADDETRQGQIRRFKTDPNCMVMIANPAAAAEGISLHMECHDAIYVDRSYNATHYLQSIDRIHRLGLPPDVDTTIYIVQNRLPSGVGSIDASVGRRLGDKIRRMERLLADRDLHELALDEENAPLALEEGIDARDIDDLVAELENRAPEIAGDEPV